jgi:hypothetical protein
MKYRRAIHWAGILIGALLFLWQLLQSMQALQLGQAFLQTPWLIVGAVLAASLANGVQMLAWKQIMLSLGHRLSLAEVISGYNLSFLPRYVPGSVWGYLSRHEWLRRQYGISVATATLGSVLEVLLIFIAGGLVVTVYLGQIEGSWSGLFALVLTGVGMASVVWFGLRLLCHKLFGPCLGPLAQGGDVSALAQGSAVLVLLFEYSALWCFHGLTLFLLAMSIGLPGIVKSFTGYVASFTIAWSIGFLILVVPSGLGIRETVLSYVLMGVLSITFPNAQVIAVLARMVTLTSEALWLVGAIVTKSVLRASFTENH